MVSETKSKRPAPAQLKSGDGPVRVLIIEARYYDDIADLLLEGAKATLSEAGVSFDVVTVPGALEIPVAFSIAINDGLFRNGAASQRYQGAVALGCVIRGETGHYDIVANNANHWLTELAVQNAIPVGNAILTVETMDQALARAGAEGGGKGGDAVRACLALHALRAAATGSQPARSVK